MILPAKRTNYKQPSLQDKLDQNCCLDNLAAGIISKELREFHYGIIREEHQYDNQRSQA